MTGGSAAWDQFEPNDWNPNQMNAATYAQLTHDIKQFGFIDPLTVRPHPHGPPPWQIIDGENRWRVARDLGIDCSYMDVGPVPDADAQKLTIILNELRGQYDPRKMGVLLEVLLAGEGPEQLLETLPFTHEALAGLIGLKDFDWKGLDKPSSEKSQAGDKPAKWVERTFRFPPDANAVVEQAIEKARAAVSTPVEDWQAIELIAADFISG